MIEFKDFSLRYSALKNPTLNIEELKIKDGEKVLIVGPSGSGKSTLGKVLNGLIPNTYKADLNGLATFEDINFGESDIFGLSKKIGTILQDQDSQFVGLTSAEDIAFLLENYEVPNSEMESKISEVLELLGVEELRAMAPKSLSGGQKQKISICGILINKVHTLLLDEPLANLDPQSATEIMQLLDHLNKAYNKTIIIVEHRLEDTLEINFDKIVLMNEGKIIACSTPDELLKTNLLKKVGIRKPLFLEALEAINYPLEQVNNVMDYSSYDRELVIKLLPKLANDKKPKETKDILSLRDVSFNYPRKEKLLDGVNINLQASEVTALLGSNGSGKSTICKLILGLEKEKTGQILLANSPLDGLTTFERGESIGYIMQNPNHYITENLVFDEVAYALKKMSLQDGEIKDRVEEILTVCNLLKYKDWPISMLSYGQRRRVTIASVLVKKPKVLIMDEPTAGQDYDTFKNIIELVRELSLEYNLGVMIITHNMQLAYEYSDKVAVLNEGKIIFTGTPNALSLEGDILKKASLKETSVQLFAKYHGINPDTLGNILR